MEDLFRRVFGGIAGGKVLDVATQEGGFVQILLEYLQSYSEIVGIDIHERAIEAARSHLGQENVRFLVMDAEQLDFTDESFDTVSISASLHHLQNIPRVLEEMKRVLKPGGHFILAEMHRDGQTEAQLTAVYLHHWAAKVDTALGRRHNRTLARQEIVDHVASLGLVQVECYDFSRTDSDPQDPTGIEQLEGVIDRMTQRAEGAPHYGELSKRGEELRQRLHTLGAQREPVLVVVGEKL